MLGVVIALALVGAGPAAAHSDLESSEPGQGQVLADPPHQLVLRFTEPVSVQLANVNLFGAGGRAVPLGDPAHPPRDETTVEVPIQETLAAGSYTVTFHLVSEDSHPVDGSIRFRVGGQPDAVTPGAQDQTPGADRAAVTEVAPPVDADVAADVEASADAGTLAALAGAARWGGYLSLALLVGPAALLALAWRQGCAVHRVRVLLWSGWAGSVACALLGLVSFGPHAIGLPLGSMFDADVLSGTLSERPGQALVARIALLVAIGVAFVRLSRLRWADGSTRLPRATGAVVLAGAAALALTFSLATHSAVGALAPLALPMDVLHLVAMAVWVGGLALVVAVVLPARDLATMRSVLPVFSRAAAICVATLAATGAFQAWRQTRSVAALVETSYGGLLIGKLALAALLVALGGLARHWLNRRLLGAERAGTRGVRDTTVATALLRRTVFAEAGVAVAVLLLSSVLVTTEPARMAYAADHGSGSTTTRQAAPESGGTPDPARSAPPLVPFDAHGGPSGRGQVVMLLEPARVGRTSLHVAVLDATGGPSPVRQAALALVPASGGEAIGVDLLASGPGHFAGVVTVPSAGSWKAVMMLGFGGRRTATLAYPLAVAP